MVDSGLILFVQRIPERLLAAAVAVDDDALPPSCSIILPSLLPPPVFTYYVAPDFDTSIVRYFSRLRPKTINKYVRAARLHFP